MLMSLSRLSYSILAASLLLALDARANSLGSADGQNSDGQDRELLEQVTVRGVHVAPRKGALADEIVATEAIGEKMIERVGATNINEAVDKNPGISVQVECSICNVRNVLLNNLPGRYTTLMIDGVPIFSSVSSAYGLDSVSVYGVERIDVARGAGVSLVAPEALSGSVNIVSKRPREDEGRARLELGQHGSRQGDLYYANAFRGGAFTATLNYNRHDSVDADGDKISEFTGFERKMGGLGLFLDDLGGFRLRGRLDLVNEKRGGGALGRDYDAIQASLSGNPFLFCRGQWPSPDCGGWVNPADGSILPYEDGRGGFSEIIFTRRNQLVLSAERPLGDATLNLALGAARHIQDSFYEGAQYDARQAQYYGEASLRVPVNDWQFTFGLNQRFENLKSHGMTADGAVVNGIDNYVYRVPALFVQAYRSLLDQRLELNASLRHDDHNVFGGITSPRLNLLYHHSDHLSSRFSVGKGFRAPTSFFEQDHGILDTLRIVREIDKPEVSHNLSYALNYFDDRLAVTASLNYNRIRNMALLDSGLVDANGEPYTLFTSAKNHRKAHYTAVKHGN